MLVLLLGWGDRWVNDRVPVVLQHDAGGESHDVVPELVCRTCGVPVADAALHARTRDGHVLALGA